MTDTSSPTVWRRWLALELTRLRREAGLEQKDVAKALRCTVAKVSYYETADRPVVVKDLDEVLLPLYSVPEDRWPAYVRAAKDARKKGWWETHGGPPIPSWFSLFVGLEQGASQIRTYESEAVPGLLQTRAYTDAITRRGTAERAEDEVERQIKLRLTRQDALNRASSPLRLWAVLNEAVLRRVVGSPAVMRDQLLHVAEMTSHPKITVQVIPFSHGAHPGMAAGPFQILGFPWPTDPGVAYVEHRAGAFYLEAPHEIEAHTVAFEHLVALALSPDESVKMVRDIAEEYA
ncbi:helix-turn-helix domain-containing protein [Streptomyces microflavus]|uniref:Transcriptional regulator n=1 Tax=Streptomyces microflavus TaxID=1919 RepID=A0A7J0CXU7_STRMI|nr:MULTISPECIES: helix-turn-helix transcriptional regulator [Streptomyces]MDX2975033.1 helix-turn-helix transcriptional regulator [Streptomyces sp. NRRL_B-2249]GFN07361.1 transcriptional regulator [Streptomyces microflavus]